MRKTDLKTSQKKILSLLKKHYPDAQCALVYKTPFQLLIATILSAQCTDELVNQVTNILFKKYPTEEKLSKISLGELRKVIYSTGFYRNKAKNIKSCCAQLMSIHKGEVPEDMSQLTALAGVGRKTANVVLGNAFNKAEGIVVDTHVSRLTRRFSWHFSKNPDIIEKVLQNIVPKKDWIIVSHWLISHGRSLCKARSPLCEKCFLNILCPSATKVKA